MQTKLKILLCALFVLALAVSEVQAQEVTAYNLGAARVDVAQAGNNQKVGAVVLQHLPASNSHPTTAIARNTNKLEISFTSGGTALPISKSVTPKCGDGAATLVVLRAAGNCTADNVGVAVADDKKKITLTVATTYSNHILLDGVRLDVSSLDVGAEVVVRASTASSDSLSFGGGPGLSATRQVATVKAGITFKVTTGSRLYCTDDGMSAAKIKVTEGFNNAWEYDADAVTGDTPVAGIGSTHIKFKIQNVPSGVTFLWPGQKDSKPIPVTTLDLNSTAGTAVANIANRDVATLEFVKSGLSADTTEAVYKFKPTDFTSGHTGDNIGTTDTAAMHLSRKDEFELEVIVKVDQAKAGAGGTADIWGWLHPEKGFDDLGSKLSYTKMPATDVKSADTADDDGDFVVVSPCVTYLLYPFLTCGGTAGWTTGLSVANTTSDDMVYGAKKGASSQSGSVTLYGYPRSVKGTDGSSGELSAAFMAMLSPNLMSGDTLSTVCPMMSDGMGWDGYGIVRAMFRNAHGAAFVLSVADGGITAAHGYMALVLGDPDDVASPRGKKIIETLGQ